ncbi:MAG TPA: STAS domain-containing protein [Acidimicrobiia bacterium]
MEIALEHQAGATIVIATGEIDMATAPELRAGLAETTGDVIIDLAAVEFLDSSGIGVLVAAGNRLAAAGGSLALRAPRPPVRRVLEIVGLVDWIEP